jgi:hypothetical protein
MSLYLLLSTLYFTCLPTYLIGNVNNSDNMNNGVR